MLFLDKIKERLFGKQEPGFEKVEAKRIVQEARDVLMAARKQKDLLELMANTLGGMVWIKKFDFLQELYTYEFANLLMCRDFFCLSEECRIDCTTYVRGKTDVDLVSEYREKTGKQHTFGDLCISTDFHATEQAIIHYHSKGERGKLECRYFEAGYIDGRAVLLDVIKTPVFKENSPVCWNTHTHSVGMGRDLGCSCDTMMARALSLIEKGQAERLSAGVIWVYPEPESCYLLDIELNR
jgi:hypothetical protein